MAASPQFVFPKLRCNLTATLVPLLTKQDSFHSWVCAIE
nr:MAG TPA: protein of unknown function (DUF1936) [Caudoviricetes sp.]